MRDTFSKTGSGAVLMMRSTLLIGVGNPYRRDDGVGWFVAEKLAHMGLKHLNTVKASGEGTELMDLWKQSENVVIVDALSPGNEPGEIVELDASRTRLPKGIFNYSSHAFGVGEAVEMGRALRTLPKTLRIFGVEGKIFEAGEGLSPEVEKAAYEVIKRIQRHFLQDSKNIKGSSIYA